MQPQAERGGALLQVPLLRSKASKMKVLAECGSTPAAGLTIRAALLKMPFAEEEYDWVCV
jgi:hypothetical protein